MPRLTTFRLRTIVSLSLIAAQLLVFLTLPSKIVKSEYLRQSIESNVEPPLVEQFSNDPPVSQPVPPTPSTDSVPILASSPSVSDLQVPSALDSPEIADTLLVDQPYLQESSLVLELTADVLALQPGQTATLSIRLDGLSNQGLTEQADRTVELNLTLPVGIRTNDGRRGVLQWLVPPQPADTPFFAQVTIQPDETVEALSGAINYLLKFEAQASGNGYLAAQTALMLGRLNQDVSAAAIADFSALETQQDAQGAVLQADAGKVTLFVDAQAAPIGTVFHFTPIFRADGKMAGNEPTGNEPAENEPETVPAVLDGTEESFKAFLPWVSQPTANENALQAASNDSALTPIRENGIEIYHQWQWNTLEQGNIIDNFASPVLAMVDLSWLAQRGVRVNQLGLWTRKEASQPWQPVAARYDAQRHLLIAQLQHFSQYAIATADSQPTAAWLPSIRAFSSDRFSGVATAQYPIDTPAGPGGMKPNLNLAYSSGGADDAIQAVGDDVYGIQASTIGYGWDLSGISSIQRSSNGGPNLAYNFTTYSMVLNGSRYDIEGGLQTPRLNPTVFAQIQYNGDPFENFAKVSTNATWVVTTTDGTRYTFAPTSTGWYPRANSNRMEGYERWHLAETRDRLGNRVIYEYMAEMGNVVAGICGIDEAAHTYTRAVALSRVAWGNEVSAGAPVAGSEKMQVRLLYAANDPRPDYQVDGWNLDCVQAHYTRKTLQEIVVEVKDQTNNQWRILHKYVLNQSNFMTNRHLLLQSVQHFGKDGASLLDTYSYGYLDLTGDAGQLPNNYQDLAHDPHGVQSQTWNNVRLASANNGYGGTVVYTYTKSYIANCDVLGACAIGRNRFPVTQMAMSDGLTHTTVISYTYEEPAMVTLRNGALEMYGRDFWGYKRVFATTYEVNTGTSQPVKHERTFFHQLLDANLNFTPLLGRVYKVELWNRPPNQTGAKLFAVQNSLWNYDVLGSNWVHLDKEESWTDGVGQLKRYFYETFRQNNLQVGNVTKVEEAGHPETSLTLTDWNTRLADNQLTITRTTTSEYFPNSTQNILSLPARSQIFNAAGVCQGETRTLYNHPYTGNYQTPPSNRLAYESYQAINECSTDNPVSLQDTNWAVTRMNYDGYGNVIEQHAFGDERFVPNGGANPDQITTVTYDSYYHLFPISKASDAANQYIETTAYYGVNANDNGTPIVWSNSYFAWGALAELCGVNDICTRTGYDGFGRPTHRWGRVTEGSSWGGNLDANNAQTVWLYTPYTPGSQSTFGIAEWNNPRCEGNFTRQLYNGFGQLVQEQTPAYYWRNNGCGGPAGNEVIVTYEYNALGQQIRTSVPNLVAVYTSGDLLRPTTWSLGETKIDSDVLGRVLTATEPSGELTRSEYIGREERLYRRGPSVNAQSRRMLKWVVLDELGNLRKVRTGVWNPTSQTWSVEAETNLSHDVTGNLRQVTQPANGGTTQMQYDLAGRKTMMDDADMGHWEYRYDHLGQLVEQVAGNLNGAYRSTSLHYNHLGQLTSKTLANDVSGSTVINYVYGADASSRGQLIHVGYSDSSYLESWMYNPSGLLYSDLVVIRDELDNPTSHTTNYEYDAYQRPITTTYPDGEVITTTYNSIGLQATLGSVRSGTIVSGTVYNEAGMLERMSLGGWWRHQAYYPWKATGEANRRLKEIKITNSPYYTQTVATTLTPTLKLYDYDEYGNINSFYEGITPNNFYYDVQNRLITSTHNYQNTISNYDLLGRLTQYEGQTMSYSAQHPHAVYKQGGNYSYDFAGNMTQRGNQTLAWNAENRLASVSVGNTLLESYLYDPNGQRVRKIGITDTTFYVGSHYELSKFDTGNQSVSDDALPNGAQASTSGLNVTPAFNEGWQWVGAGNGNPNPLSGTTMHKSGLYTGTHWHGYSNMAPIALYEGDVLHVNVYLDPAHPPREIVIGFRDDVTPNDNDWEHFKCWGDKYAIPLPIVTAAIPNLCESLPPLGQWIQLDIPVTDNGLGGVAMTGMDFVVADGQMWWDNQSKERTYPWISTRYYFFNGQRVAMSKGGELYFLHSDHLGSTIIATDRWKRRRGDQKYYAYGRTRQQSGYMPTDYTFTGQKQDATGLIYMNARYYDPQIGAFISPDTIVPEPTNLFEYNRYMFVRGNPLKYIDPSGHCGYEPNGSVPIPCWEPTNDNVNPDVKAKAEAAFRHLLRDPAYFANLYVDPEKWNASDEATYLGIYTENSVIHLDAVQAIATAYIEAYGMEAYEQFQIAAIDNVYAQATGEPLLQLDNGNGSILAAGFIFVMTPSGAIVPVPDTWVPKPANSGKGVVYQEPTSTGNANMIRIMEPTPQYPNGYIRYYNKFGQPIDPSTGKPGSQGCSVLACGFYSDSYSHSYSGFSDFRVRVEVGVRVGELNSPGLEAKQLPISQQIRQIKNNVGDKNESDFIADH